MFEFEYTDTNYEQLVHAMGAVLKVPMHNDHLLFPEAIGAGTLRHVHVPNGLHAYLIDCTWHQDWHIHSSSSAEEFYTLRFDELTVPNTLTISIGDEKLREKNSSKAFAVARLPSPFSMSIGLTFCGMVDEPTSPLTGCCVIQSSLI